MHQFQFVINEKEKCKNPRASLYPQATYNKKSIDRDVSNDKENICYVNVFIRKMLKHIMCLCQRPWLSADGPRRDTQQVRQHPHPSCHREGNTYQQPTLKTALFLVRLGSQT